MPSMPTPEIDLVALDVKEDELLLVEVKSLLDSYGVYFEAVSDEKDKVAERYRLFTNRKFRTREPTRWFSSVDVGEAESKNKVASVYVCRFSTG